MKNVELKAVTFIVMALTLGCLVFAPGLSGPFFFDDHTNLLSNRYVQVRSLTAESLYSAAFSLTAGPLQRPIAMISFALNHYFAGSFESAFTFKLVNLVIHFLNGLLVYWLVRLLLDRANKRPSTVPKPLLINPALFAGVFSLLWLIHPIQISSVLYVVQRMTELSALFSLLGLICYIKSRNAMLVNDNVRAIVLMVCALFVFWPAALYSKETALLLPLFALTIEYSLFATEKPWKKWHRLSAIARHSLLAIAVIAALSLLAAAIAYSLPLYSGRSFTMIERVMTEARVLFFYLGLILVPRIDQYGLFHDDIAISTSLLTPWTTAPALLGLIALFGLGLYARRRRPLLGLGILWFFAGHLLESTIFPLELAHEHRNYLPSIGVFLAIFHVLGELQVRWAKPLLKPALIGLVVIGASVTALRADQWSSENSMASYEAAHHPDSPASQVRYANILLDQGDYDTSQKLVRRAAELAPHEPSYLISIQVVATARREPLRADDNKEIIHRLSTGPISAATLLELSTVGNCVTNKCQALKFNLESWALAIISNPRSKDLSFAHFLVGRARVSQGRYDDALIAYKTAHELDRNYAHPLLDLAQLYVTLGYPDHAEIILEELRRINERMLQKRDEEIERLANDIEHSKTKQRKRGGSGRSS